MSLVLISCAAEIFKRVLLCLLFISCPDRLYISLMAQVVVALLPWSMLKHCSHHPSTRKLQSSSWMGLKYFLDPLGFLYGSTYPQRPCQLSRVGFSIHSPQPGWQQESVTLGALRAGMGTGTCCLGPSLPLQHSQTALGSAWGSHTDHHPSYTLLTTIAEEISSMYRIHPNFLLFPFSNSKNKKTPHTLWAVYAIL